MSTARIVFSFVIMVAIIMLFCAKPDLSYAQGVSGATVISQIVQKYEQATSQWIEPLKNAALKLFKICTLLSVALLGVNVALGREDVPSILKQFIMMLIMIGFFLWCLQNYEDWTDKILKGLPALAGNNSQGFNVQDPVQIGVDMIVKAFEAFSGWDVIKGLISVVMCSIALVCLAMITGMLILVKCEACVGVAAAILLMGLGGSTLFKDYAINVIRYVFATGFKLLVMTLVAGIGVQFIKDMNMNSLEVGDLVATVAAVLILFLLTKEVPSIVSGIISGSNVSSGMGGVGGGLAGFAGGMVGGALGGMTGAYHTGRNLVGAARVADAAGATGVDRLTGTAGAMWQAHQAARQQPQGHFSHPESMHVHLKSRLQEMKMNPPKPKGSAGDSGEQA